MPLGRNYDTFVLVDVFLLQFPTRLPTLIALQ